MKNGVFAAISMVCVFVGMFLVLRVLAGMGEEAMGGADFPSERKWWGYGTAAVFFSLAGYLGWKVYTDLKKGPPPPSDAA